MDPTRDANIAAIIMEKQMIPVHPLSESHEKDRQKSRDTVAVAATHESHRTTMQQTLQALGVQSASQRTPTELIKRKAQLAAQQASGFSADGDLAGDSRKRRCGARPRFPSPLAPGSAARWPVRSLETPALRETTGFLYSARTPGPMACAYVCRQVRHSRCSKGEQ